MRRARDSPERERERIVNLKLKINQSAWGNIRLLDQLSA